VRYPKPEIQTSEPVEWLSEIAQNLGDRLLRLGSVEFQARVTERAKLIAFGIGLSAFILFEWWVAASTNYTTTFLGEAVRVNMLVFYFFHVGGLLLGIGLIAVGIMSPKKTVRTCPTCRSETAQYVLKVESLDINKKRTKSTLSDTTIYKNATWGCSVCNTRYTVTEPFVELVEYLDGGRVIRKRSNQWAVEREKKGVERRLGIAGHWERLPPASDELIPLNRYVIGAAPAVTPPPTPFVVGAFCAYCGASVATNTATCVQCGADLQSYERNKTK
jgi:hypothetical protein